MIREVCKREATQKETPLARPAIACAQEGPRPIGTAKNTISTKELIKTPRYFLHHHCWKAVATRSICGCTNALHQGKVKLKTNLRPSCKDALRNRWEEDDKTATEKFCKHTRQLPKTEDCRRIPSAHARRSATTLSRWADFVRLI
jgi:hypothetical protein